jgi:phage terminase small subunit
VWQKLPADPDLSPVNGAEAAGYKNPVQDGWRLWKDEWIKRLGGQMVHDRSVANAIDDDRVLKELARIAFSDIGNLVDADGQLLDLQDLRRDVTAALKRYKKTSRTMTREDGTTETETEIVVEFWDKLTALEQLGKHLGLFGGLPPAVTLVNIDWSALKDPSERPDPMEQMISNVTRMGIERSRQAQEQKATGSRPCP